MTPNSSAWILGEATMTDALSPVSVGAVPTHDLGVLSRLETIPIFLDVPVWLTRRVCWLWQIIV